jgi:hypothetical protein
MIAASVAYHLDLNESALKDPESALDQALQAVRDDGHVVEDRPEPGNVTPKVVLAEHRLEVREVHYLWSIPVDLDPHSEQYRSIGIASLRQDAVTGDTLSIQVSDPDIYDPDDEGPVERLVPGASALAVAALALGALARVRPN